MTRRPKVTVREYVWWALEYHVHQFRRHPTFSAHVFSFLQKSEALSNMQIKVEQSTYKADVHILISIMQENLNEAAVEEAEGKPISIYVVQLLRKKMRAVAGKVMASDQSRYQLRSQIWSTAMCLNPPSLWVTINPDDLNDLIVQVLAGERIDLDNFVKMASPDSH